MAVLDFSAIQGAPLSRDPYDFFLGKDFLRPEKVADLRRDFPDIKKPGFLTVDEVALKGAFKDLIDELEGPALTEELSKKFGPRPAPLPAPDDDPKISQSKDGAHPHRRPLEGDDAPRLHERQLGRRRRRPAAACSMTARISSRTRSRSADHGHRLRLPARRQ